MHPYLDMSLTAQTAYLQLLQGALAANISAGDILCGTRLFLAFGYPYRYGRRHRLAADGAVAHPRVGRQQWC